MMGRKKLSEVKAALAPLFASLPAKNAKDWFAKEIARAERDRDRDPETLRMLAAALESPPAKPNGGPAKPRPKTQKGAVALEEELFKRLAEMERAVKKRRKPKARRRPAKR
jgi:hypothetical protein